VGPGGTSRGKSPSLANSSGLSLHPRRQLGKDPSSQALAPRGQVIRILLDDPPHHFAGTDRQKHARLHGDVDAIRAESFDHQRSPVELPDLGDFERLVDARLVDLRR
jgi:hypothetical protein